MKQKETRFGGASSTRILAGEPRQMALERETRFLVSRGVRVPEATIDQRRSIRKRARSTSTASTQEMTPSRAVGLMFRRSTDLPPEAKMTLKQIGQIHPHVENLNTSLQHFLSMVRHLRGGELEQWI